MKNYVIDTNVFLRFLLQDHKKHYQTAKKYFLQARKGKIKLILIPEIVLELNYVLRGVYSLSRKKTASLLEKVVKSPDLKVQDRNILIEAVGAYEKTNVDLTDLFIYQVAQKENTEVLSFNKDFSKIIKRKTP